MSGDAAKDKPADASAAAAAPATTDAKGHRKTYTRKSIIEMSTDEKVAKVQALVRGRRTRRKNPNKFKHKNLKGSASIASTLTKEDAATATAAANANAAAAANGTAPAATSAAAAAGAAAGAADAKPPADPNAAFVALLNSALATENVDEIAGAIAKCQAADWTKHRAYESAEKTLKHIRMQIKTLAILERTVTSRRMADLEQALNMAEEYDLNRTDEAQAIAQTRNAIVELKALLENAPNMDDIPAIDAALARCTAIGLVVPAVVPAATAAAAAGDAKDSKAADAKDAKDAKDTKTGADDATAAAAAAAFNKDYEWISVARARRDLLSEREAIAAELATVVRSNDLSKLEAMFKKCVDANFPPHHPLYEAAQIKLAELQAGKQLADGVTKPKAEKKKMDPYAAKGGATRPAVSIQQYAIPKYVLHKCPLLRSGDDFSNGTLWNRKRVKAYQLLWQADPPHRSLTTLDEKKVPKDLLVKTFKMVQGFMGDKAEPQHTSDLNAIELMRLGHARDELRDELYALILKQTTVNPKEASTVRGWQLLGLVCEAFPPSDAFLPFVFHYIYYNSKAEVCPAWAPYAKYCMYTLHNTVTEPLKPVTDFTLEHVQKFRTRKMEAGKVRVYFLDGSEFDVFVQPHDRVCDSLQTIFDRIKLRDRPGFGVFSVGQQSSKDGTKEVGEGREIWIPLNACLLDYDPQMRPSVSPVLYKQQASRLVFKRRLYTDLTSPDPMAQRLLYYQTLVDICNESLPVGAEQQLKLVALHRVLDAALNSGVSGRVGADGRPVPPDPTASAIADANMLTAVAVRNIVPVAIENGPENKKAVYLEKVSKLRVELAAKKPKLEFETLLKEVRERQLFGCQYFTTKALEDRKKEVPKGLMMGISSQGIYLVHGKDKKVFEDYPFFQIARFECTADRFKLYCKVKNSKQLNAFTFRTDEAEEIAALMTTLLDDIASVSTAELF